MNPLFFGDSQSPLFGIHQPPAAAGPDLGVVLCPPVAQEYIRTHWAFVQLANQLSRAGVHVLRFDYFGVGDSAGASEEGTVARWRSDITTAAQELRDLSGVRTISIVGLRLGAALAATTEGLKLQDLVLWDPVVSGVSYLKALEAAHARMLKDVDRFGGKRRPSCKGELVGFPLPPPMRDGIAELELLRAPRPAAERTVVVVSEERPEYASLRDHFRAEYQLLPPASQWENRMESPDVLVSGPIVQAVTKTIAEGAA